MNDYYHKSLEFQEKIKEYARNIFKTYGRELVLRLEEYNLLQNKHNCIESSTAIGFVLEEFLVSKLEMYTHCSDEEYRIDRFVGATSSESFDCFSIKDDIKYMVNVKCVKQGSNNDAVAAIRQLYRNYCLEEPEQEKSFILFKVKYEIRDAYEDSEYRRAKPRHLYISELETFCIEEIDFSKGHQQDNRSWSANSDTSRNNGRLQISSAFRREHKMSIDKISYQNTYKQLQEIIKDNH